jgi:hypothetical protein
MNATGEILRRANAMELHGEKSVNSICRIIPFVNYADNREA